MPTFARALSFAGAACVVTTAALGAWYGCSVYDPSLLLPAEEPETGPEGAPPVDAGRDTGMDVESEAANPCADITPPPRPATDDPSDAGNQAFIAALHTLDLGVRPDGGLPPLYGYDLDGVYTCCGGQPESCKAAVPGAQHCDEEGGRDNSGGQLISGFALVAAGQFNSDTISLRLQEGVYSLLLQISQYNGQANDSQVVAALYASDGIQPVGDAAPPTKWDGTDVWTVDQSFVLSDSPIIPNHFDPHAYVSGGVLVMAVDFPISLGTGDTGNVTLAISGGVITGNVVAAGNGQYRLANGQIAGRWAASSVLQSLESLNFGVPPAPICRDSGTYAGLKQEICRAADITADPTAEAGATCDSLSIAFGFTADPALMGDVTSGTVKTSLCGDLDAAPDDCTTP